MYSEEPTPINLGVVERLSHCPASYGVGTRLPRNALDRWIAVRDACASWHNGMSAEEAAATHFGAFDEVQRRICSTLLRRYTDLMSSSRDDWEDVEGDQLLVRHPREDAYASAAVTFTLTGDGGRELVKLRTGRRGSSPWERAILTTGKETEDSVIEVMAPIGTIEELEMGEEEAAAALDEIFEIWDRHEHGAGSRGTVPGWWCFTCPRPARCGQYPTPDGSRVPASTRTVVVSKTWARAVSVCERKVAWKHVHQIPRDDWTEDEDWRRDRGIAFHELAAAALAAKEPDAAFAALLEEVPDAERQNLAWLWERHRELESGHEHPVRTIETEYQVGATLTVPGTEVRRGRVSDGRPVAIVLTARADATGREEDGTPAVIELKTGPGAAEVDRVEADIYALGASLVTGAAPIAVHLHQLGLADGPRCVRLLYDVEALEDARERLDAIATKIAAWHPEDAASVPYSVGAWCHDCPFRARCEDHRG